MEDARCCCWEYNQWRFLLASLDSLSFTVWAGQGSSGNTTLADQGLRGNNTGTVVSRSAGIYECLIVPPLDSNEEKFPNTYLSCCQTQQYSSFHDNSTFSTIAQNMDSEADSSVLSPSTLPPPDGSEVVGVWMYGLVTVGYQTQEVALTDHLDCWSRRSMNEVLRLPTLLDQ